MPARVALMLVVPCKALAARPLLFTTATVGVDEVQVTTFVMSWVDPSLKEPLAVNCCEEPRATVGFAGVTVMLCTVAFVIVIVVVADARPLMLPVTVKLPAETPVTRPCRLTRPWRFSKNMV